MNNNDLFDDQLRISRGQLLSHQAVNEGEVDEKPLPRTLEDALRPSRRAIVITEASSPFRIFDVNHAWEELCGYTYLEARGQTLGSMLQGPATNKMAATSLIARLLQGDQAGTTLINYKKNGQAFSNRIRVGPLLDENNQVSHFVGVLQEVHLPVM